GGKNMVNLMKNKKALTVVMLALVFTLIVGCSGSNSDGLGKKSGEIVTINYANFSGAGEGPSAALEKMKEAFEKINPDIKVNIDTIGYGEYFTQMQTRVTGGTAPDAYELNYENFVSYARLGVLEDLGRYFDV